MTVNYFAVRPSESMELRHFFYLISRKRNKCGWAAFVKGRVRTAARSGMNSRFLVNIITE